MTSNIVIFSSSTCRQLLLPQRLGPFQGNFVNNNVQGTVTNFYKTKRSGGEPPSFSGIKNPNKIRFEMMFNVRCLQCKNSIGKGVRFNAHKKTVDQYLSTKIYEFTMNCHLCSNKLVIRTDPKGCDYQIISGLEKRVSNLIINFVKSPRLSALKKSKQIKQTLITRRRQNKTLSINQRTQIRTDFELTSLVSKS